MRDRVLLSWFYVFVIIQYALAENQRQKRCIVIQKQSGTHGDSTEADEDEDYRRPQPKEPKMDRIGYKQGSKSDHGERNYDVEEFTPEIQKLRKRFERLRLKKNRNPNLKKIPS